MRIALITAGVVVNIIEADLAFAQTLGYDAAVEATTDAHMHGSYANGVFTPPPAPPAPPPPPPITVMSKLAFLRRFTQAERLAIRAAMPSDPVLVDADAMMKLADSIDVADPDTVNYVGYLASKTLVAQARVSAILAPEPAA